MTTRFSVNPSETLPSFDIREQIAYRDIYQKLLDRSKSGEILEFPKIVTDYPHLREYRSYVLDLVYEDYCQRSATGESNTQDYDRFFPEYSKQIHELFEVHQFFHASGYVPEWLADQKIWPMPGEEYLGFHICSEMGRGAIGRVYLAKELKLAGRFVALKVSPYGHDEAKLLAKLTHPHIVPIYSVREDVENRLTAVCMPYKGRTTLADLLVPPATPSPAEKTRDFWKKLAQRSTDFDARALEVPGKVLKQPFTETALELIVQVTSALVYVHEQNILHRDLKPSNILITPERSAMILDFNLSTDLSEAENRIGGTLPYMSPEQVEQVLISPHGKSSLDEKTDLFSLGVICYEMLTGQLPFQAESEGVISKQEAIEHVQQIQAGPIPIQQLLPALDDRTAKLIHQCLDVDKSKRPASARAMLRELARCRSFNARMRRSLLRHPRRTLAGAILMSVLLLITGFFFLARPSYTERQTALGREKLAAQEYQAASVAFRAALTVEPASTGALNGLGRAQFLLGELQQAKETWQKSFEIQNDPKLAACIGYLACCLRDYDSAVRWFDFADPDVANSAEAHNNIAHAYIILGTNTHAEAFEHFAVALKLNSDLRPSLYGYAILALMADRNAQQPLRNEALQYIDRAIAQPHPYPELLALGAVCHLATQEISQLATAKALAIRALEAGLSFPELENELLYHPLLQDPDIAKYRDNPSLVNRKPMESLWIDPWPGLFLLP